jgi:hypothetical protein
LSYTRNCWISLGFSVGLVGRFENRFEIFKCSSVDLWAAQGQREGVQIASRGPGRQPLFHELPPEVSEGANYVVPEAVKLSPVHLPILSASKGSDESLGVPPEHRDKVVDVPLGSLATSLQVRLQSISVSEIAFGVLDRLTHLLILSAIPTTTLA